MAKTLNPADNIHIVYVSLSIDFIGISHKQTLHKHTLVVKSWDPAVIVKMLQSVRAN